MLKLKRVAKANDVLLKKDHSLIKTKE